MTVRLPGDLDAGDTFLKSDTTDADGDYELAELVPGSFIVCEVLKSGWVQTHTTSGADCSFDPLLGPVGYAFTTSSGTDKRLRELRACREARQEFEDNDGDGDVAEDSGDPLSDWTIKSSLTTAPSRARRCG